MSAKKPRGNCKNCGLVLNLPKKIYCNFKCQQDFRYQAFIVSWRCGEVTGVGADGDVSGHIRRYLREKYNNRCAQCGWNQVNAVTGRVPVEVEHIDGNCENSKEDNLTLLCPNCHSLTPTYRALNKGSGRAYRRNQPSYKAARFAGIAQ